MADIDRFREKISTPRIVKHIRSILVASLLLGLSVTSGVADQGTATGSRVNVRGQAKITSEVVTQLKKGERVTIIDEVKATQSGPKDPKRFYKIILPSTTPVWISAKYVKDGVVTANRLNVRSGAGENFSVLGRISKGASVSPIRTVGDWLEISSPGGVHGYVATSLIKSDSPAPTPIVKAPSHVDPPLVPVRHEPVVPVAPPPASLEVVEVTSIPTYSEPVVTPQPVQPAPIQATTPVPEISDGIYSETTVVAKAPSTHSDGVLPNELLTPPAEPEEESGPSVYKVIQPSKKKTMLGRWWERVTTSTPKEKEPSAETKSRYHEPAAPEAGPPAVRIVTREGIVVRAWNIQAPSDWALKEIYTGKIVNYLWSGQEKLPWEDLRGRTVLVTGEEAIDPRWQRTPVLNIQTLKTIDGDGDGEG